jgi:DNA invertase Pin-like site-specific DNA recombinase
MLRDAVRGKFDILAAWAVDRLGRSLQELVATLGELRAAGVDLFLHQQAVERRPRVAGRLACSAYSPSLRGR